MKHIPWPVSLLAVMKSALFSMQVLQKALDVFGLSCQNLDSPECKKSLEPPELEIAFICNLRVNITACVM